MHTHSLTHRHTPVQVLVSASSPHSLTFTHTLTVHTLTDTLTHAHTLIVTHTHTDTHTCMLAYPPTHNTYSHHIPNRKQDELKRFSASSSALSTVLGVSKRKR